MPDVNKVLTLNKIHADSRESAEEVDPPRSRGKGDKVQVMNVPHEGLLPPPPPAPAPHGEDPPLQEDEGENQSMGAWESFSLQFKRSS